MNGWLQNLLFVPDRTLQLVAGIGLLVCGVLIGPFVMSKLVLFAEWANSPAAPWQLATFKIVRAFFAFVIIVWSLFGALYLTSYALVANGLVDNPWKAEVTK